MPGIVLTFPILPGKVEAWRRFCQEMAGARSQSYEASRRRLGITRERMALVENAFGAAAITTLEAQNIGRTLAQIMTSDLPFDGWYRARLEELHGVNLTRYKQFAQPAPANHPQELLFEWSVPHRSTSISVGAGPSPAHHQLEPSIREITRITPLTIRSSTANGSKSAARSKSGKAS